MAALPRELKITYGGYTVGGDQTSKVLEGVYTSEYTYEKAVVGFSFVILESTGALFTAACLAAEAAFRLPRQNLTIMLGLETLKGFSHSNSTGFNSFPSIVKREDGVNGARSRRYHIRIEFGLPADNVGTSFRRYSYVNVAYSPARQRTLTISGTYTAGSSASARTNYESAFAAYAASVQTTLTGTWKLLEEPQSTADDQNKEINFSATYEEILFTSIGAGDAALRGERFTVTPSKTAPGDSPVAGSAILRLTTISATYEAWFDKTVSVNLQGKWAGLRGNAISQMQEFFNGATFALTVEAPAYDPVHNKITVRLEAQGASFGGVVSYTLTSSSVETFGIQHVPVMNGKSLAKYRYQGPGSYVRTITQDFEVVGGGGGPSIPSGMMAPPNGLSADIMVVQNDQTPFARGIPPDSFSSIIGKKVLRIEFYEPVGGTVQGGTPTPGTEELRRLAQPPGSVLGGSPGQGSTPA